MKRYTLRAAIHDARIFNQLRLEYRRTNKNRRKDSASGWLSRYLGGMWRRARALANVTISSDTLPYPFRADLDQPAHAVLVRTMQLNFLPLAVTGLFAPS